MTDRTLTGQPVIVARHLTKVYRLYERPQQRILDILGLGRSGKYTEHFALDDVSFSVNRGERVGIIGRNGAGKSTLLKLATGVIPPTRGEIRVNGDAKALLEIGTGFHPEFTGRDNAKAYFAQLGLTGPRASQLIDQVIEFSELEEYIDQPLKTYSTGMRLRLMFATSTTLTPDILVLDEVLGVGDAYFTLKSFERINEMSHRAGATLLLVSHDVYTSARICDRMIWLERGRIVFDGEPKQAITAYEDSIRQQEEARLRAKSRLAIEREQVLPPSAVHTLSVEVASAEGRPLDAPLWFRSVRLFADDDELASLPLLQLSDASSRLDSEGTSWSEPAEWQGVQARPMQDFGSPFHRVSGTIVLPRDYTAPINELRLELEWGADVPLDVVVSCRLADHLLARHQVTVGGEKWERYQLSFASADEGGAIEDVPGRGHVFGTGRVRIRNARLLDSHSQETFEFWHGDPFHLSFDYEIRDPQLCEQCDIVVAILRGGVETALRSLTRSLELCYGTARSGTIRLTIDPLLLGTGTYSASVMIAEHGYYEGEGHLFYSVNPSVHVCVRDFIDFAVQARGVLAQGTAWVAEGKWELLPTDGTGDAPPVHTYPSLT